MTRFDLYPAIDLRGGRCVRLLRGDYARETVYGDDPVAVARGYARAGVEWIHVVDLDAARSGTATNLDAIRSVAAAVPCRVEAGGGVRDAVAARRLLDAGVARVVVGTAAVERPELVQELCGAHPGRIAVGLDARGRDVATHGWTSSTGADLVDLARGFAATGVAALVVTEIERDGTLEGPDVEQLRTVLEAVDVPVVASGGVGTLDDLRTLTRIAVRGRELAGAIVGRALYERRFTVEEAMAACSRAG